MAYFIGLYYEDSAFYIAEISGKYQNFKITRFLKIPFESKEEGFHKLAVTWKELKFKGKVCVGLPFANCIFRTFTVPYMDKQKVAQVVHYETENHVHPHTAEELVLEHEVLSIGDKNSKVAVHAILKSYLKETLRGLEVAKIEPDIVTTDAVPLYYASMESQEFSEKPHSLLILPGKKQFRLITIADHKITQVRTLRFGCEEEGYSERLIREIQKGFVTLTEPLQEIGVLGDESVTNALNQAQEELGCPTVVVKPNFKMKEGIDPAGLEEIGWIPVYLARAMFQKDAFKINFRKGYYSKDTPFSIIRVPLFFCFMWFVVLCLGIGLHFQNLMRKQTPTLNQINKYARDFATRYQINTSGTSEFTYTSKVRIGVQGKLEELIYGSTTGSNYILLPAFKIWNDSFHILEQLYKNFGLLRFEYFLIKQNHFSARGLITSSKEIEEMIRGLQKVDNLEEVVLDKMEIIPNLDLIRFQIKGKVQPKKN